MNTVIIPAGHNLIEEVIRQLGGTRRDYSSHLVVFPGKRPSHFLRRALAQREKAGFIPPRIFSMDEFIDFVYGEVSGIADRKLETLDAVSILYKLHQEAPARLGSHNFLKADIFFPLGFKLYHDLEELHIENVSLRRIKEIDRITEEAIPQGTIRNLQLLSYFYETFYQWISASRCSTRSSRYRTVSEHDIRQSFSIFNNIIFAGFFAPSKSEQVIFKHLADGGNTVFIFQDGIGLREKLAEMGAVIVRQGVSAEAIPLAPKGEGGEIASAIHPPRNDCHSLPIINFYKSPDTHGQVYGMNNICSSLINQGTTMDEKTAIVIPSSDTLFPLYHHTLGTFEPFGYNISLGYPLHRTPVFGFLNKLMQLVASMDGDRLFIPDYLAFVLHPYTKNIYYQNRVTRTSRADITRILFHAIEEALIGSQNRKFLSLTEIENNNDIIESIKEKVLPAEHDISMKSITCHLQDIHRNTIGKMISFASIEDFARQTIGVLTYIAENSTAPLHQFFYPYLEVFIEHLDIISRSLLTEEIRFDGAAGYFNLFRKYIMTCRIPFEGTPLKGVQVLGFLETRNLKFDTIFLLDANEEVIPETQREDSLLPFKARQALGLPTYTDREKLMAYYFETLIAGAKGVYIFYVENDEKERSRFVEKLLWEKQKREGKRDANEYIKTIRYSVNLNAASPRPVEKSGAMVEFLKGYAFSASSLNMYLQCPLKFYYSYVLDIKQREDGSDRNAKRDIGTFVHDVLHRYFDNKKGRLLTEKDMNTGEMERLVDNLFGERYGNEILGDTYLLRQQIKRHMVDYIEWYQIPKIRKSPTEILELEHKIKFKKDSFNFEARLDRIEKRGDRLAIIDYKTSGSANYLKINFNKLDLGLRETWPKYIGSIQLPIYLLAYAETEREVMENIDCMFLLLGKTELDGNIELPLFNKLNQASDKYDLLYKIIFSLLEEIVNPNYLFTPTIIPDKICSACDFRYICSNQN